MSLSFAEALRRLRIQRSLSQQRLAELLHVDRSTIAKWETGDRMPDAVMLSRLSNCLDADVSALLAEAAEGDARPNVILVDDERIILAGGLPILHQALPGAVVTGFARPSDALAFARENRVALAFLDIEMGRTSGLTLCKRLLEINPRTNVIFLTAYSEFALNAWDTGACGFLLKPLSVEAVLRQLTRLRYPAMGLTRP